MNRYGVTEGQVWLSIPPAKGGKVILIDPANEDEYVFQQEFTSSGPHADPRWMQAFKITYRYMLCEGELPEWAKAPVEQIRNMRQELIRKAD